MLVQACSSSRLMLFTGAVNLSVIHKNMQSKRTVSVIVVAAVCSLMGSVALAEACWDEWEYEGQWLMRASQCAVNVSIADFARGFCQTRVQGDTTRKAAQCPTTAKGKEGLAVVARPVVARCLGMSPPESGGKADVVYYGGPSYEESRESLSQMCVAFEGKWVEGAK